CSGNFVAHAGVTVFHMIGVGLAGTPQTLHVAGQRASSRNNNGIIVNHAIDGAQNSGLAQLAAGVLNVLFNALAVCVVDFGGKGILVGVNDMVKAVNLVEPFLAVCLDS